MATKKEPIPVMLVTFRLPLGTMMGRLGEEQTRYRIETVAQYHAVVRDKYRRTSVVESYVRGGEKVYARENGAWCTLTAGTEIVKEEVVMVER